MNSDFSSIYQKFKYKVYGYVLYKVNNTATAEDITSECFLRLFKQLQRDKSVLDYVQAWLYRTAINLIIDNSRSAHYKKTVTESEQASNNSSDGDDEIIAQETNTWADEVKDIMSEVINDEKLSAIKNSMKDLNAQDRNIIELRLLEELPFAEISVILNIQESAAKMRFKRALDKLKILVRENEKQ